MTATLADAYEIVDRCFADGFAPPPLLTVSQWADRYRILSSIDSAEPGPYRTSRTPYLREVMDCLSPTSPIHRVVLMKGSQVGATQAAVNWIGETMHLNPGPLLSIHPDQELASRTSRTRIDPMIEDCPELAARVASKASRDGGNATFSKAFRGGGQLFLLWASSTSRMKSTPAKYIVFDEEDEYELDVGGQGDACSQAERATMTFPDWKVFENSTPTTERSSRVAKSFARTDQRHYYVPCPHCEQLQVLFWVDFEGRWSGEKGRRGVIFDDRRPETARYRCIHCNETFDDDAKLTILRDEVDGGTAEWRPTAEAKEEYTAGFHLSALYSPHGFYSWQRLVEDFLKSRNDPMKLMVWWNQRLGLTWREKNEAPPWIELYRRRETYTKGTVPRGGLILFVGADVQHDRIEAEVVAFGRNGESWSVAYHVFMGNTSTVSHEPGTPWRCLEDLLGRQFPCEAGGDLAVCMMAVDSSDQTQVVYSWTRRFPPNRVMAIKGASTKDGPPVGSRKAVDVTIDGKTEKSGAGVWSINVHHLKTEFYGWLRLPVEEGPLPRGWCHFPEYDDEHFKRLTNESLVRKKNARGYYEWVWEKQGPNEQLDCRVYARAASLASGMESWVEADWVALERALAGEVETESSGEEETPDPLKRWRGTRGLHGRDV